MEKKEGKEVTIPPTVLLISRAIVQKWKEKNNKLDPLITYDTTISLESRSFLSQILKSLDKDQHSPEKLQLYMQFSRMLLDFWGAFAKPDEPHPLKDISTSSEIIDLFCKVNYTIDNEFSFLATTLLFRMKKCNQLELDCILPLLY